MRKSPEWYHGQSTAFTDFSYLKLLTIKTFTSAEYNAILAVAKQDTGKFVTVSSDANVTLANFVRVTPAQ